MKQIKNRLNSRQILWIQAVIMGLLPLLCCIIHCASQGYTIGDVYLPASDWNDELFYFKQVESMLSYGYPYGYFGFNESHALKLSFAAWSPVLVFPWLVLGKLFGWTMLSPVYYNIFVMMLGMVLYVLLARPKWKELGILTILFCVFTPFTRYMLCGMPECICFSMLIIFYGLMCRYQEDEKNWQLVCMFVIAGSLTLMRPYLILFLIYPVVMWIRKNKWWGVIGSALLVAVIGGLYVAINHFLGAEYFTPLFKTDWLMPFLEGRIFAGIKGVLSSLYHNGTTFVRLTIQGCISGMTEGAFFAGYLALMVLFAWQAVAEFVKKNKEKAYTYAYLAFCFLAMTFALILMYKMKEGSKHLLTFMAMGIFVLSGMTTRFYKKAMFYAALCVYLYSMKADSAMDYQVYFANDARVAQVESWEKTFAEELTLQTENVPNYDNVIIWVFSDELVSGEGSMLTDWQILYALPKGFGVSCCYADFITENFDQLQSKYITIPKGSKLEQLCIEKNKRLIGEDERVCVFELHP